MLFPCRRTASRVGRSGLDDAAYHEAKEHDDDQGADQAKPVLFHEIQLSTSFVADVGVDEAACEMRRGCRPDVMHVADGGSRRETGAGAPAPWESDLRPHSLRRERLISVKRGPLRDDKAASRILAHPDSGPTIQLTSVAGATDP